MLTNIGDRRILHAMEVDVEKLIRLREERVLSQRDLARMAGLAQGTVWRLENGFAQVHPSTIRKLAEALGVEPKELLRRREG
jgi:transcriptional regulator with XRE-family HTH domain